VLVPFQLFNLTDAVACMRLQLTLLQSDNAQMHIVTLSVFNAAMPLQFLGAAGTFSSEIIGGVGTTTVKLQVPGKECFDSGYWSIPK
jgi:hypothetical protein